MTDVSSVVVDQAGNFRKFRDQGDGTYAEVVALGSGDKALGAVSVTGVTAVSGTLSYTPTGITPVSGTVSITGTAAVSGTVTATPSGTQAVSGTVTTVASGTTPVSGTVTAVISGTVPVSGTVTATPSGIQEVSGTLSYTPTGTTPVSGAVSITGTAAVSGTVTTVASGTTPVSGSVSVGNLVSGQLSSVLAMGLQSGAQPLQAITCTSAAVDYSGATAITSADTYLQVFCSEIYQVAMGQATASNVGAVIGAGLNWATPVKANANSDANIVHARTLLNSAVVYVTYLDNVR